MIGRCLSKDPGRRFQHMADLKAVLEELKEESDSGAQAPAASPASRRRRRLVWASLVAMALGLVAWLGVFRRPAAGPAPRVGALTVLPGVQLQPALSPDGKQVAFVWNGEKEDNYDIYVQLASETTPRRLTSSPASEYGPVWSPDALHIAFLRDTPAGTEVVVIPAAGGVEKRLHVSTVSCSWLGSPANGRQFCGVAWSPNGKFLTLVDKESPQAPKSIFLLDIATREMRKVTAPPRGYEDGLSVFSPDGRMLAFSRNSGHPLNDIYVIPLSDSGRPQAEPLQLTRDNVFIEGMDWTADNRGIVFSSSRGGAYALWRVASSGGMPVPLAIGSNGTTWPSISRSGDRLVYCYGFHEEHVWRVAAPGSAPAGMDGRSDEGHKLRVG